ncbi:unnamed protein product [Penicillium pancosmium]
MSNVSPVILILGAGPNVGQHVADEFSANGYKTALVSRNVTGKDNENQINIAADLSDPDSVSEIFSKVEAALGIPSVVVYNAAALTITDAEDPLSISISDFNRDLVINTTSALAAAKYAASGFEKLPESASKTFIYTGNVLNTTAIAPFLSLGVGKSASAHFIQVAAEAYVGRGYQFYYADERKADGSNVGRGISGDAHAKFYFQLSELISQGPWHQTFVKDVGYKKF